MKKTLEGTNRPRIHGSSSSLSLYMSRIRSTILILIMLYLLNDSNPHLKAQVEKASFAINEYVTHTSLMTSLENKLITPSVKPPDYSGTIYLFLGTSQRYESQTGFAGGGPTTVSTLHWSLNQLGFNSMLYLPSELISSVDMLFDTNFSPPIIPIGIFPPPNLTDNDVVIFPENVVHTATPYRKEVAKTFNNSNGARIIILTLGLHEPDEFYRQVFLDHTVVTISDGLMNAVGNVALVPFWRPLDKYLYTEADKYLATGGSAYTEEEIPPDDFAKGRSYKRGKENLILFDNDTPYRADINRGLKKRKIQGVWLTKMKPEDMVSLYSRAKGLVDGYFPGPERHPLEASMFGVIPILSDKPRGATYEENPTLPKLRVDSTNTIALLDAIYSIIDDKVAWGDSNPSAKEARRIKRTWKSGLEFYFSSLAVAFDIVVKPGEEMAAVIAAAHAVLHNPLARIHLGVESHALWVSSDAHQLANSSLIAASIFVRSGEAGKLPLDPSLDFKLGGLPSGWRGLVIGLPVTALVSSPCFVKAFESEVLEQWGSWPGISSNDAEYQVFVASGCIQSGTSKRVSPSSSMLRIQKYVGRESKERTSISKKVSYEKVPPKSLKCGDRIGALLRPLELSDWKAPSHEETTYPSWLVKQIKMENKEEREKAMPNGVVCV
jgi:hypothetical protein